MNAFHLCLIFFSCLEQITILGYIKPNKITIFLRNLMYVVLLWAAANHRVGHIQLADCSLPNPVLKYPVLAPQDSSPVHHDFSLVPN